MSFRSADLLNLVRDYGSTITLRKLTDAGTYNPATGSISDSETTDYPVIGYFFTFSAGLPTGDEIRRGTSRCVLPASGLAVVPNDEDQIVGLGNTYNIVTVQTIYSDGAAVCYICEVRE